MPVTPRVHVREGHCELRAEGLTPALTEPPAATLELPWQVRQQAPLLLALRPSRGSQCPRSHPAPIWAFPHRENSSTHADGASDTRRRFMWILRASTGHCCNAAQHWRSSAGVLPTPPRPHCHLHGASGLCLAWGAGCPGTGSAAPTWGAASICGSAPTLGAAPSYGSPHGPRPRLHPSPAGRAVAWGRAPRGAPAARRQLPAAGPPSPRPSAGTSSAAAGAPRALHPAQ